MDRFKFFTRFSELDGLKNVDVSNKILRDLAGHDDEVCLGQRQVGERSYHIFYLNKSQFCVYYHGGGADAVCCSEKLDDVLGYVNNLRPEDLKN
ncbi:MULTISPECIES: hypothetical protein [unclassified Clostridium]|uniref:hypothetical protein n=1 Tax=unclassified Clostridium TaxID=2614128 RepID=UPI001FA931AC|nr:MULTISPECIES: hypothetical protein [unclassified Clostridium]